MLSIPVGLKNRTRINRMNFIRVLRPIRNLTNPGDILSIRDTRLQAALPFFSQPAVESKFTNCKFHRKKIHLIYIELGCAKKFVSSLTQPSSITKGVARLVDFAQPNKASSFYPGDTFKIELKKNPYFYVNSLHEQFNFRRNIG